MPQRHQDKIHRLNCLSNDLNSLYHQASRKLGVSDSVSVVLYMIYDKGDGCLLYDIWNEGGTSKQTINSAVRRLEADGILYLERDRGKAKRVRLTETGREYVLQTVARLYKAECRALESWTEDEIETYLRLMKKYNDSFRAEIEKM